VPGVLEMKEGGEREFEIDEWVGKLRLAGRKGPSGNNREAVKSGRGLAETKVNSGKRNDSFNSAKKKWWSTNRL